MKFLFAKPYVNIFFIFWAWSIPLAFSEVPDGSKPEIEQPLEGTVDSKQIEQVSAPRHCEVFQSGTRLKRGFGQDPKVLPQPQCLSSADHKDKGGIAVGGYFLDNNAWNHQRSTWKWKQCIELRSSKEGVKYPHWSYDWGDENSVKEGFYEWEVRSFPRVIYGLYGGKTFEESCSFAGLPVPYSKLPKLEIDYSISSTQTNNRKGDRYVNEQLSVPTAGGDRNSVLEARFYEDCSGGVRDDKFPAFRIMIWLEVGPERRPAQKAEDLQFTDSLGQKFTIYSKQIYGDDGYLGFTVVDAKLEGKIILNEFIEFTSSKAKELNLKPFNSEWCLANISLGSEIWWGEGAVSIEKFDIIRTY